MNASLVISKVLFNNLSKSSLPCSPKKIILKQGKSNVAEVDKKYLSNPTGKLPDVITIVSQTGNTLVLHYGVESTARGKNMKVDIEDTFTKQ